MVGKVVSCQRFFNNTVEKFKKLPFAKLKSSRFDEGDLQSIRHRYNAPWGMGFMFISFEAFFWSQKDFEPDIQHFRVLFFKFNSSLFSSEK